MPFIIEGNGRLLRAGLGGSRAAVVKELPARAPGAVANRRHHAQLRSSPATPAKISDAARQNQSILFSASTTWALWAGAGLCCFALKANLFRCEPSRFSSDPDFDLGFLKAAFDGDLRLVKRGARAVGRGAEGRRLAEKLGAVRDGYGNGLLHSAAIGGSLPVCRYLVEDLRLDVDDAGPQGETTLTFAIGRQNVDLVRYFLDQGADVHKVNDSGSTPLNFAAATRGCCEIVELLLSKGADVDEIHFGGTALHLAANHGLDDTMKVLLDHHADHKITLGGSGYTALFIATAMCSLKCVKLLLEAGADVDGACKETPLMVAATAGSTDILKCLVLAGADANVPDSVTSRTCSYRNCCSFW
uniref:Uncharacterized protein n=1 Tax=Avena sativa TaxID=4498 RepID=A0ACD6A0G3_AVESA